MGDEEEEEDDDWGGGRMGGGRGGFLSQFEQKWGGAQAIMAAGAGEGSVDGKGAAGSKRAGKGAGPAKRRRVAGGWVGALLPFVCGMNVGLGF